MRKLGVAVALTVGMFLALPASGYELRAFEGKSKKATLEELAPKTDQNENKANKFYFEQYSFDLKGSKGDIWFQVIMSNMAVDNGKAAVLARYTPEKGEKLQENISYDRAKWSFKVDKEKMGLDLGRNTLVADGKIWKAHLDNDKFLADVEIKPIAEAWRPGGGTVFFGKGDLVYYDMTIVVPRGEFTAKVTIKATGEKIETTGLAYGDHSVWNIRPDQMARSWMKIREVEPGHTVLVNAFQSTADYGSKWVGYVIIIGAKGIEATFVNPAFNTGALEADADSGYMVPKQVTISATGEPSLGAVIKATKLTKRTDRFAELSEVEKLVVKMAGVKPIEFKHRSDWEFTLEKKGKKTIYKGKGGYIYEQLIK